MFEMKKEASLRDNGQIYCYISTPNSSSIFPVLAMWEELKLDFPNDDITKVKLLKLKWPSNPIDGYALLHILPHGSTFPKGYTPVACLNYYYQHDKE